MSFSLSIRVSFWKGLAACLADVLRHSPLLKKRHPHAQSSLLSRCRRRCGGWALSGRDSSGIIGVKSLVRRKVPVDPSRLIFRRIKGIVVSGCMWCLPTFKTAQIDGVVEIGDGSDGSGNWGLFSWSCWMTAIVANTLKRLGGKLRSLRLGRTIEGWLPNA